MTKKDYEKIAYSIAMSEPDKRIYGVGVSDSEYQAAWKQWNTTQVYIARVLRANNEKFNTSSFFDACKFDYWKTHKQPVNV